ncbi:MAG: DNA alkylation repair protein [Cyclobacteriaceae bacterium]
MIVIEGVLNEIKENLFRLSSDEAKKSAAKFVPTANKIYGVRLPGINALAKKYKEHGFPLIEALWQSGWYEERLLVAKLLTSNCRNDPERTLELLKRFKDDIDNWAVCDTLCSEGIRPLIKKHGDEVQSLAEEFLKSDKMWVRRMGIVMLIHFAKIPEKKAKVRQLVAPLAADHEHYIKKAIVWINRYLDK